MSDNNDVDQQQQIMPNSNNNNNNDPSTINPPTTPLQSSTTSPTTTQSSSSPLSTTTISSSQEFNNNGHNMSQSDPPTTPTTTTTTTPIASTSVSSPTSPASSTTLVDKTQQQQQQLQQQQKESDEQMEKIVLKFLKQKGYAKALSALKSEAPHTTATIEQMIVDIEKQDAMTTSNDKEILNEYLENTNLQRSNSRRYLHAYQSLTDWVYSSLDIYKNEVIQVLYPVFIHCYLELILKGFKEEARKFLGKYKSQHTHFHYDEVLVLQSLTSPDLIAQNEFAQRVLNHKFIIRLSQASFELLMKFLQDSELNLLAILNRFVNFKVYKGQPSITAPAIVDGVLQLDTSSAGKKGKRDDQQSVTGSSSKRRREESEDQDESSGKHSTDLLSANRIKPIRWETSVSSFESAQATAGAKEPGKRGRKKKSELEAARQMKQLAEAASRATPTLPSVCFYTMFNCKDELNTLEIAVPKNKHPGTYESNFDQTNGPIIAGGFSDSTIKCWNWNLITNRNSLSVNGDMMDGVSSSSGAANQHQNGGHVSAGNRRANSVNYQTLVGHCGPVYSLSFNSDQRWLLSSSEDGTARLWNVETGSNIVVYKGHQYAVWDVAFSPLDYVFATASHDRTARIWVTDRVTPVRVLAGHLSDVECVKFHPNSKYVATGSSDKTVRLWDIDTGECVRLFRGHYGSIHTLAFSHDGRYCASAGQDEQVYVWDIASGRHVYKFSGHTDQIWSLDFNHTDTILASSSLDCTIRLWDLTETTVNKMMSSTPASSAGAAKPDQKKILDDEENKRAIEKGPLKTLYTKQTPVYSLTYLQKDVLLAGGCFSL